MSSVPPPSKGKHLSRVTVDEVAFYYSKQCRVLPLVHLHYIDLLTQLESQSKVCFTPAAILERYHINLKKRNEERLRKYASNKR
jgi:hypothetical protein